MKQRKFMLIALCGIVAIMFLRHSETTQPEQKNKTYHRTIPLMGTAIGLSIRGVNEALAEKGFTEVFARAREIDKWMSTYKPESEVSLVNKHFSQDTGPIAISHDLDDIITRALTISEQSQGAFDITVHPIIKLWKQAKHNNKRPSPESLAAVKSITNYKQLQKSTADKQTRLQAPKGMKINFGAIGKGYTADKMAEILLGLGIENFLLDIGSDLLTHSSGDNLWRVGIRHPLKRGEHFAIINIENGAVATSGDYEQFYTIDGIRYTHIVDPRTAEPIREVTGASVLAANGAQADALATALCVMPPEQGLQLIAKLKDVECLILKRSDTGLKIHKSAGWP